ncbi:hypothetical protein [Enterobacter kobei]|uniref:hypothetical protein n=1 Tax=Enterobacter kobei TaxID=208224 RepID=UPI0023611392|nr:hypothetical protein [Enterobacter kobei]
MQTENVFLKVGIETLVEHLRIDTKKIIFVDFTLDTIATTYETANKYIFICNSGNKYLTEIITSHLTRIVIDCKTDLSELVTKINSFIKKKYSKPSWCNLSDFEIYLLPMFCSNLKMQELSDKTGVSLKYLYNTRNRLRKKLGLEQTIQFYRYRHAINFLLKNHTK